jgi:hypothetical protein
MQCDDANAATKKPGKAGLVSIVASHRARLTLVDRLT